MPNRARSSYFTILQRPTMPSRSHHGARRPCASAQPCVWLRMGAYVASMVHMPCPTVTNRASTPSRGARPCPPTPNSPPHPRSDDACAQHSQLLACASRASLAERRRFRGRRGRRIATDHLGRAVAQWWRGSGRAIDAAPRVRLEKPHPELEPTVRRSARCRPAPLPRARHGAAIATHHSALSLRVSLSLCCVEFCTE